MNLSPKLAIDYIVNTKQVPEKSLSLDVHRLFALPATKKSPAYQNYAQQKQQDFSFTLIEGELVASPFSKFSVNKF